MKILYPKSFLVLDAKKYMMHNFFLHSNHCIFAIF